MNGQVSSVRIGPVRLVSAAMRISSGLTWRRRGTGLACLLKDKINRLWVV